MAIINGVNMPDFSIDEFSEDPVLFAYTRLLHSLQCYRYILDEKIYPSKASGALARFEGREESTHFVNLDANILARGIDVFPDCSIFKAWTTALYCGVWNGTGVYFDTNGNNREPWPMLHLDLRPVPLIWYRNKGKYFYPHTSKSFFADLQSLLMLHNKGKYNGK